MDRIKPWALPGAIVIAGVAVAAALVSGQRYTLQLNGNSVWRSDHFTGQVVVCGWSDKTPVLCMQVLPVTKHPLDAVAPK